MDSGTRLIGDDGIFAPGRLVDFEPGLFICPCARSQLAKKGRRGASSSSSVKMYDESHVSDEARSSAMDMKLAVVRA